MFNHENVCFLAQVTMPLEPRELFLFTYLGPSSLKRFGRKLCFSNKKGTTVGVVEGFDSIYDSVTYCIQFSFNLVRRIIRQGKGSKVRISLI